MNSGPRGKIIAASMIGNVLNLKRVELGGIDWSGSLSFKRALV
jgi:hypothetical protein